MSWDAARAALDGRLLLLSGIDKDRIHWPNRVFDPAKIAVGLGYWKVDFLPASVEPEMGPTGKAHEKGIYQVSIFTPADSGLGPALQLAQAVVDHYQRQVLSGVACGVPRIGPYLVDPEWFHVPVSIPFQAL